MPNNTETNALLHAALEKCLSSRTPLDCLAQEIGRLAMSRDWARADIHNAACKAMRMLAAVLEPPADLVPVYNTAQRSLN